MDALTTAMNAHDSDTILAFYEDAEDFVRIGCTDVMHGSRLFKTLMAPHYRATSDVIFEREILTVQILTPTSAVVSLRGGSTVAEDLFWTQVLVKDEGGRWLIAHEHQSWPGCRPPPAPHPTGTMTDPGEGA